ncbi:MAG: ATP synthase F1 subunit gamma [Lachnospiraceae bacterium]|nr:ATP synthase F1 subunit gamma [Lachnospiraceae bacterium]
MAGTSEIKERMEGVRETKKITDAMYMISSAKMRRALQELEKTTPYFHTLGEKIGEVFYHLPSLKNRYFHVEASYGAAHKTHGVLLITADKGLAGAYNQEAVQLCMKYRKKHPQTKIFIVGEYGRQYFLNKNIPFEEKFYYMGVHPQLSHAREICADLLSYYDEELLDDINIIYTDYIGTKPGECKLVKLLPLELTKFHSPSPLFSPPDLKEFIPNPTEVLEGIIPSYLTGFIYGCLVESFCSEQQARMNAMKNAGENAEEMLDQLKLQYNKIRQSSITNEMIEITAGVRALKRRRKQNAGENNERPKSEDQYR